MRQVELPEVKAMSPSDRVEAMKRVSLKTPEALKTWLAASGRRWLIFDSLDLVDSLPWPGGVETLMQITTGYDDHRRTRGITAPLTPSELDQVVRHLIGVLTEQDPTWNLG